MVAARWTAVSEKAGFVDIQFDLSVDKIQGFQQKVTKQAASRPAPDDRYARTVGEFAGRAGGTVPRSFRIGRARVTSLFQPPGGGIGKE